MSLAGLCSDGMREPASRRLLLCYRRFFAVLQEPDVVFLHGADEMGILHLHAQEVFFAAICEMHFQRTRLRFLVTLGSGREDAE